MKECRAERLLQQLAFFRKDSKRENPDYQYWKEGSHPQLIENEQALWQKLEYIYRNPVVKQGYVDEQCIGGIPVPGIVRVLPG